MKITGLIVCVLLVCGSAVAQTPKSAIQVQAPWSRSTPPMAKTAAVYMTVVNTGTEADRLLSASTPVAGEAGIHRTTNEDGVMKMSPAGPIEVKPGSAVTLRPGELHVMMMDLKQPLADGQTFPLDLVFEKAGRIEVMVKVQRTPPADSQMGKMGGVH